MWIGTVNGGVWRTETATDGLGLVQWKPLLDLGPSMSISALALDRTVSLNVGSPKGAVLVAGIGDVSAFNDLGSAQTGIVRTIDGGDTWIQLGTTDLSGLNVTGIVARGNVITVATKGARGGIWRSIDTGKTFVRISGNTRIYGLPAGDAYDLVGDPGDNLRRMFAAVDHIGVFESDDLGANWTQVDEASTLDVTGHPALFDQVVHSTNMRLAVHDSSPTNQALYFGVVNKTDPCTTNTSAVAHCAGHDLVGLYRIDLATSGASWTALDVPGTCEPNRKGDENRFTPCTRNGAPAFFFGINPVGQGRENFSIVASPTLPNVVYIGGDTQPAPNGGFGPATNLSGATAYNARLFKCDAGAASGQQCDWITDSHAISVAGQKSAPHADSRATAFDAAGNLVQGDDGGVYRLLNTQHNQPSPNLTYWISINGGHKTPHLQVTENISCDYDSITNTIICANQDNDVAEQIRPDDTQWKVVDSGDGVIAAVDDLGGASSVRYSTASGGLIDLARRTCQPAAAAPNSVVTCTAEMAVALKDATGHDIRGNGANGQPVDPGIPADAPFVTNSVAANRFVAGTTDQVWETNNGGNTVTKAVLSGGAAAGVVTALAYGGTDNNGPQV